MSFARYYCSRICFQIRLLIVGKEIFPLVFNFLVFRVTCKISFLGKLNLFLTMFDLSVITSNELKIHSDHECLIIPFYVNQFPIYVNWFTCSFNFGEDFDI